MKKEQQTLWEWVEQNDVPRTDVRRARGNLMLAELPAGMRLSLADVQTLHRRLEDALEAPVDLALTDNRRRMVSAKRRRGRYEVRLHHMFVGCDDEVGAALAGLAGGQGGDCREVIRAYIEDNRTHIRTDVDPAQQQTEGAHHDLQAMLDRVREGLRELGIDPADYADVTITWGKYGRGRRSIRFGSFDFDTRLIRIHPVLDQDWVPGYFVEFIVYHEILHAVCPPERATGTSRRCVHTPRFRQLERQYVDYHRALAWEKTHIRRLLDR